MFSKQRQRIALITQRSLLVATHCHIT